MLIKSLAAESATPDNGELTEKLEPEYTFAGFNVEFSAKIMLTPVHENGIALRKG